LEGDYSIVGIQKIAVDKWVLLRDVSGKLARIHSRNTAQRRSEFGSNTEERTYI
jgi:hypothetical protein